MFTRYFYAILAAAVLVVAVVSAAIAFPIAPAIQRAAGGLIASVHGCHRSCEAGPAIGWHRHGFLCRPNACMPLAPAPHRCWIDRAGVRRCRW
jgi:hypothetical protein